jgi:UDP-N-acetylglucosamine 2-epimerase (non-hydrolysing)
MKVLHVVGARPNFIKAAPVIEALKPYGGIDQVLVHTGQHFDEKMSAIFFTQLNMPQPNYFLGVHGGSHGSMIGRILLALEEVLEAEHPARLIVYGDVNSTLAGALAAAKRDIPVSHVEAGLRSNDRTMPEELNRILTDQIADQLFVPSLDAEKNLHAEGIRDRDIQFVGNVMIDSLVHCLPHARKPEHVTIPQTYALVTLHRPANVDDHDRLAALMDVLEALSERLPVLFPIHPRTRQQLEAHLSPAKVREADRIQLVEPLGYLEFLWCLRHAALVLTDSGGIQEETTYLRIPCYTARDNTERPITIHQGTNTLVGSDASGFMGQLELLPQRRLLWNEQHLPEKWDGNAAPRIAEQVVKHAR